MLFIIYVAFAFGFINSYQGRDFERLHIFLFNLTTGGSLLLYHSGAGGRHGFRLRAFLVLSALYAGAAFLKWYLPAIAISLIMFVTVESVRIEKFGFFPRHFFRAADDTSSMYHDASLLCLSLALLIAVLVMVNDEYLHLFHFRKLTLNVFFLGYSFPVSLLCFSLLASIMKKGKSAVTVYIDHGIFWTINLGVIMFFVFILFETFIPMLISAVLLALAVIEVFYSFITRSDDADRKIILVSGMYFLLGTALTGILYLVVKRLLPGAVSAGDLILKGHAYLALYGWNLSGMLVILCAKEGRSPLEARGMVVLIWLSVLLAVTAKALPAFVPFALMSFAVLLLAFDRYAEKR